MLIVITQDTFVIPKLVPRANGVPVLVDLADAVRDNLNGNTIIVPVFSSISENLLVEKNNDVIEQYALPDIASIVIDKKGIYEIFNEDGGKRNQSRYIEMNFTANSKWFYVRGNRYDDDLERIVTVGLHMGKSIEEIAEIMNDSIPGFNSKQYHIYDRHELFGELFSPKENKT